MTELEIDGRTISFVRDGKLANRPLFVCAHGAGAPYTSPFMVHVAKELAARDVCVVRFHVPYMEEAPRTGKKKPPDPQKRLLATWRAMHDAAHCRDGRPHAARWRSHGAEVDHLASKIRVR